MNMLKCAVNLEVYGIKDFGLTEKKSSRGYEYYLEDNPWVTGRIIEC